VVLTAQLTRLYERADWRKRFAGTQGIEPRLAQRASSITVTPSSQPKMKPDNADRNAPTESAPAVPVPSGVNPSNLSRAERIARLNAGLKALEEAKPLKTDDPSL
jgi:hypothetical protein